MFCFKYSEDRRRESDRIRNFCAWFLSAVSMVRCLVVVSAMHHAAIVQFGSDVTASQQ